MSRKSNPSYWKKAIQEQKASKLSQAKWCEQNNVNIHNFRYWKNRMSHSAENSQSAADPKWTLITSGQDELNTKSERAHTGEIDIQIGKIKVILKNQVDQVFLSDVIKVLLEHV